LEKVYALWTILVRSVPARFQKGGLKKMISMSQIILEEWEKGSEINKNRLRRYRLLVETFTYNCMERLKESVEGEK